MTEIKPRIKIASRFLLPLELYMASQMIAWGISGAGWIFAPGHLYGALHTLDEGDANFWWGLGFCGVGGLQSLVSGVELLTGRAWRAKWIFLSVSMRCVGAFFSTLGWILMLYIQVTTPAMHSVVSMWFQIPLSVVFNVWAYGGNLKVRTVLDPTTSTSDLEERILHKRRNLLPMYRAPR